MNLSFPVWIHIGSLRLHPHWVFEVLAYSAGFRLYLWQRTRQGDFLAWIDRAWVAAGAIAGAAIGSKLLYWFEDPAATLAHWNDPAFLMGGKTIVGGLLGGVVGVEWIKRNRGILRRTGDLFVVPLCVGIFIGRFGCFLTGLGDQTYGVATTLPWGVDFGDGIARHPVQLYESAFAAVLGGALAILGRRPHADGFLFRVFLVTYMTFRVVVDFWKPGVFLGGLTSLQWCSLAAVVYYAPSIFASARKEPAHG